MNFRNKQKNNYTRSNLFTNIINNVDINKIKNKILIQKNTIINKKENCFWENENNPSVWVSLLIPCYNTKKEYLIDCINSIKEQIGNFGIELIWINDYSNDENTNNQVNLLDNILKPLKNFKLIYEKMEKNKGISSCLNYGVNLCSNEIIFRMDTDDIMKDDRIKKQLHFILSHPFCVMCGSNMTSFQSFNGVKKYLIDSIHKNVITWEEYKTNPKDWILNHPTLCFKKTAILHVGNYKENFRFPFEDLDLELRVLKKYGIIYNISEILLLYRIHNNQESKKTTYENKKLKLLLINQLVKS